MFKKPIIVLTLLFVVAFVIVNCFGSRIFSLRGEIWANHFLPVFFATLILLQFVKTFTGKNRPSKTDRFWIPIAVMFLFFMIVIPCAIFAWPAVVGGIAACLIQGLIFLSKK
jgi:uncharacterized membrane protein